MYRGLTNQLELLPAISGSILPIMNSRSTTGAAGVRWWRLSSQSTTVSPVAPTAPTMAASGMTPQYSGLPGSTTGCYAHTFLQNAAPSLVYKVISGIRRCSPQHVHRRINECLDPNGFKCRYPIFGWRWQHSRGQASVGSPSLLLLLKLPVSDSDLSGDWSTAQTFLTVAD